MFRRKFTATPSPDHTLYVVGDIHGRADLLESMLSIIAGDRQDNAAQIIFVGDYFDRGL